MVKISFIVILINRMYLHDIFSILMLFRVFLAGIK
jgi:hypothetical protein